MCFFFVSVYFFFFVINTKMNKNASILKDILCNGVVRYSNNARTYLLNISFYRFVYLFFTIIYNNCSLPFYEHFAALYGENARALVYLFFFFFFWGHGAFVVLVASAHAAVPRVPSPSAAL